MSKHAPKLQSTGLLAGLVALFCVPCALAPLFVSVGVSSILVFLGQWFLPILFLLLGVSLIGFWLSFRRHKNSWPLSLAVLAIGLLLYNIYSSYDQRINLLGAVLLVAAITVDYVVRRLHKPYCDDCDIKPTERRRR